MCPITGIGHHTGFSPIPGRIGGESPSNRSLEVRKDTKNPRIRPDSGVPWTSPSKKTF